MANESAGKKQREFRISEVPAFDARQGYRRCAPPGIGVTLGDDTKADADFWRGPTGNVFARISNTGYVYHLEATRCAGGPIRDQDMDAFAEYFADVLLEWLAEGVDELPDACFEE